MEGPAALYAAGDSRRCARMGVAAGEGLDYFKRFVNWYIDNRQISKWRVWRGALRRQRPHGSVSFGGVHGRTAAEAHGVSLKGTGGNDSQGLFANGLASGQYDELHSYEDGINVLGQMMLLDFGSPKEIERAMETSRAAGVAYGHQCGGSSAYPLGLLQRDEDGGRWRVGMVETARVLRFQPALSLVLYNGAPETRKMVLEVADGLLAHRKQGPSGRYSTMRPSTSRLMRKLAAAASGRWRRGAMVHLLVGLPVDGRQEISCSRCSTAARFRWSK